MTSLVLDVPPSHGPHMLPMLHAMICAILHHILSTWIRSPQGVISMICNPPPQSPPRSSIAPSWTILQFVLDRPIKTRHVRGQQLRLIMLGVGLLILEVAQTSTQSKLFLMGQQLFWVVDLKFKSSKCSTTIDDDNTWDARPWCRFSICTLSRMDPTKGSSSTLLSNVSWDPHMVETKVWVLTVPYIAWHSRMQLRMMLKSLCWIVFEHIPHWRCFPSSCWTVASRTKRCKHRNSLMHLAFSLASGVQTYMLTWRSVLSWFYSNIANKCPLCYALFLWFLGSSHFCIENNP